MTWPADVGVLSTSSLTPTIDSLPSLKLTCALPLVSGKTPVSAVRLLKSVEERESERSGGTDENEECKQASSAGEYDNELLAEGMTVNRAIDYCLLKGKSMSPMPVTVDKRQELRACFLLRRFRRGVDELRGHGLVRISAFQSVA